VLDTELRRNMESLQRQFSFYKPHEKVRFRLILENQKTAFKLTGGGEHLQLVKEKPDGTLRAQKSYELI